ncbi:methylenetetrahydrofolate reductase [Picosynechococcus sp. NKBG15041c]|uniref:methylenetetrahydrofolate reductase n=1 Tax=Picosynechococcus sp. NKBG15041c TaxID=1407650 RepID=UPI00040BCFEA|nr:methylenetetrahydrofolate reductase [Picosynechococcus sp. NKBG15041c]
MTSRLRRAIENREFVVTAEVAPPKGGDPMKMLQMAKILGDRVHGINVTDGSRAVMRMSSIAASTILLQNGIEPIFQMACRDRNVIGLQADLLGAQALGLRNVLALTGDPVKAGDHPKAKAVFDLESVRLLKLISKLNGGQDFNDKKLPDGPLALFPGGAVDPQLKSWYAIESRFARKVEAGAQFFQSQMITDFNRLEEFMTRVASQYDAPVFAGIFLLKSAKNAQFINRCVPGAQIPDAIIERLAQAENPLEEGMKIAAEQVKIAKNLCQGVHMMAVKKEDLIPQILDLAGVSIQNQ